MAKFKIVCSVPVNFHVEMEADTWDEACEKVFAFSTQELFSTFSTQELFSKSIMVVEPDSRIIQAPTKEDSR